ncbi:hypothetical protein HNR46_002527 [Haloferula luteola]|uniref:Uncharacterized protein n=1 Tax=Haloferula luteola TaxID=595692 RepID=A0A840V9M2_9BACT|nr:hypothetical protein [Haloferula luteola]MBB5352284.1 hypothetical protein [Haloferula luteola]
MDRFRYYTDGKQDFVVLKHGTCVVIPEGLSEDAAAKAALEIVSEIFGFHPDMNPLPMDDGNLLISYNHPAYSVVLEEVTQKHFEIIRQNHLNALATDEVLMTPDGPNRFDDFGMKALFGRCFFFMDAKMPVVTHLVRRSKSD